MINYTKLPIGTKLDSGEIQVCTYCGKHGIAEKHDDKIIFVHGDVLDETSDTLTVEWVQCPPLSKKGPHA